MTALEETKFETYTLGAATFDLSGLPKEYYTLVDGSKSIIWVQPIFQALGLKSLLAASLPVENFTHAVIHGNDYTAVVIKQHGNYLALLIEPHSEILDDQFLTWAQSFDATSLRNNPKFQVI
ncbi:hypothetical protein [Pseudanabaena yagii]|jgi:hypothetical protein|uniref:Aminomethyltransferase folate-binding domain-containing protein n=1 Tax=Pseudanabaena yagii GIHE-NHR1 TaxID=2722753 RepID=A0ABX1LRE9_9CYAN|nr:hypothetical protein [Pseudanabaena yagii]NMF58712.1 hypothetical protein [Pseudanabaena yagii GIHE-NHR1]